VLEYVYLLLPLARPILLCHPARARGANVTAIVYTEVDITVFLTYLPPGSGKTVL